jgi:signal transduction histidine kinase
MQFISGVSHELRTPLAVICSAADNLADGVLEGKRQLAQYRSIITSQARQLTELVDQILTFAATGEGSPHYHLQALRAADVIDATLEKMAGLLQDAGFSIERQVQPNLPQVTGDLPVLSQCLQNLIVNAVKYSGDSRWIAVQARLAEAPDNGREVQITIADRGVGIASAEVDRIFQPFYRTPSAREAQIHGTGLGLSLAKTIAESLDGRLTVTSEVGVGSSFTVHLPVADAPMPNTDVNPHVPVAAGNRT